jgi:hypothetical protein
MLNATVFVMARDFLSQTGPGAQVVSSTMGTGVRLPGVKLRDSPLSGAEFKKEEKCTYASALCFLWHVMGWPPRLTYVQWLAYEL